jgi:hypothetical protein
VLQADKSSNSTQMLLGRPVTDSFGNSMIGYESVLPANEDLNANGAFITARAVNSITHISSSAAPNELQGTFTGLVLDHALPITFDPINSTSLTEKLIVKSKISDGVTYMFTPASEPVFKPCHTARQSFSPYDLTLTNSRADKEVSYFNKKISTTTDLWNDDLSINATAFLFSFVGATEYLNNTTYIGPTTLKLDLVLQCPNGAQATSLVALVLINIHISYLDETGSEVIQGANFFRTCLSNDRLFVNATSCFDPIFPIYNIYISVNGAFGGNTLQIREATLIVESESRNDNVYNGETFFLLVDDIMNGQMIDIASKTNYEVVPGNELRKQLTPRQRTDFNMQEFVSTILLMNSLNGVYRTDDWRRLCYKVQSLPTKEFAAQHGVVYSAFFGGILKRVFNKVLKPVLSTGGNLLRRGIGRMILGDEDSGGNQPIYSSAESVVEVKKQKPFQPLFKFKQKNKPLVVYDCSDVKSNNIYEQFRRLPQEKLFKQQHVNQVSTKIGQKSYAQIENMQNAAKNVAKKFAANGGQRRDNFQMFPVVNLSATDEETGITPVAMYAIVASDERMFEYADGVEVEYESFDINERVVNISSNFEMDQDEIQDENSELHMISNIIKLGIMRGVEPANYYTFYLVYDHLGIEAADSEHNQSQLRSRSFGLAFFAANIGLPSGTCVFSGVITTSKVLPDVVSIKNNLSELGNEVNILSPSHLGDKFDSVSERGYSLVTGIGPNFFEYPKAATSWSGGAELPPISVICSPYDLYMIPMKAQWSTKGVTVQRGILEANLETLKKLKDGRR